MPNPNLFVQEPDYINLRRLAMPLEARGAVYDGDDPYATPLGLVFNVLESNRAREVYVPRGSRMEEGRVIYTHDLGAARYVLSRNGFEGAQLKVAEGPVSDETRNLLRMFFEAQNTKEMNRRYVIEVGG